MSISSRDNVFSFILVPSSLHPPEWLHHQEIYPGCLLPSHSLDQKLPGYLVSLKIKFKSLCFVVFSDIDMHICLNVLVRETIVFKCAKLSVYMCVCDIHVSIDT